MNYKNRNMYYKIFSIVIFSSLALCLTQSSAYSIPSKWEDARRSLSELLDSGWQITGHGTNRVAANSNSGNGFDVKTFSFVLSKDSKYIICITENPKPPIANDVSCRKLN
jgi:hypothetical protein